jgi:diphthamide biosynthesis protein 2
MEPPIWYSCCIDEVAAEHVDADLVVHYGSSCLSKPSRISTWFVFEKKPLDIQDCFEKACSIFQPNESIYVIHDTVYDHVIDALMLKFKGYFSRCYHRIISRLYLVKKPHEENNQGKQETTVINALETIEDHDHLSTNRNYQDTLQQSSLFGHEEVGTRVLFIGGETRTLVNLLMLPRYLSGDVIYVYDPERQHMDIQHGRSNRWVMKR